METGGSGLAGIKDQLLYSWVGAGTASLVTLGDAKFMDIREHNASGRK